MKIFFYSLAALLALLGLVFVVGAQGQVVRIVVGVVLFLAAGGLIFLVQLRPQQTTITQQIDLSGDVGVQELACSSCGGRLTKESVEVRAGAVFVHCPYCGSDYQLEEEPKW
jgi:hypothetical protein